MSTRCFKLTDENMRTHGNFQWTFGEWKSAPGKGALCTAGWIHCYDGPELALIMNPNHANFTKPRLFAAEYDGATIDDRGCKRGVQSLRVLEEITSIDVTIEHRQEFAIACALMVYHDPSFVVWASQWIRNIDRSANAADAANAAYAAAYAAANAAAYAAANAANAAAYAAYAAAYAAANAADATYADRCTINLSEIAHDIITGRSR